MQSRVRRCRNQGFADPASLGRVAASVLADEHETGGAPGLGCKLQTPTREKRQWFVRLGNDQPHGGGSECLFDAPEEVALPYRTHYVQALADLAGQTAQHQELWRMGRQDPEQRAGVPRRLEKCEGTFATPLCLVHAGRAKTEGIARPRFRPHGHPMQS